MSIPTPYKQETLDVFMQRCEDQGISAATAEVAWMLDALWWKAMKAKDVDALRMIVADLIELQRQMLAIHT